MEIILSDWVSWSDRLDLPDTEGVYLVGKGSARDTTYVGRTWAAGGLRDRVRAFHRSATTGQKGHAGGVTYFGLFGGDMNDLSVRVHVPIAVNQDQRILRPYIEYAERRIIWEFVVRHGDLPACNSE